MDQPWWREAVFYQVYPRSFADSDGDGIGDLDGLRNRLDHLVALGVDALWLSPIYPSPQRDFGYDVADHCDVDPCYGDLGAFDRLLAAAHDRGLRVLLDWVPNHVSDQHRWFQDALRGRDAAHRDWFVWRDSPPGSHEPPNNWIAAFPPGRLAWTYDSSSGQWYLHLFLESQPDLDWNNPEVEKAMLEVLRFWLDRGVDGFRADVIHAIAKVDGLPPTPDELVGIPQCALNDVPETHERLRRIRALLDSYGGERVMLGEVYLLDASRVATYYGTPEAPELHLALNPALVHTPWDARAFAKRMDEIEADFSGRDAWPVWNLSSHDEVRHRTRFDRYVARTGGPAAGDPLRSERRVRAAAVLCLTQRGTPLIYQGEELGLAQVEIPPEAALDPGGRDGCRTPIPWDGTPGHGWPAGEGAPWLPLGPEAPTRNVAAQLADAASTLHLYKRAIALRKATPALVSGDSKRLPSDVGVLAWRRSHPAGDRIVVVNFGPREQPVPDEARGWVVELASDDTLAGGAGDASWPANRSGQEVGSSIAGEQALVLRPR